MASYRKVLVAVDGSSCSSRAVKVAVDLCGLFGAEMHMIFVVSEIVVDGLKSMAKSEIKGVTENLKMEGKKYFRDAGNEAKKMGVKTVEVLKAGFPADEIITYAKKNKMDLIVMGTHGSHSSTRPLIGSVANRVIHLAPSPILIVP